MTHIHPHFVLNLLHCASAGVVCGVRTESGHVIDCERVVIACGMWSKQLAGDIGVGSFPTWSSSI